MLGKPVADAVARPAHRASPRAGGTWPWIMAIDSCYANERDAYLEAQRALAGRRGGGGRLGLVSGLGGLSA
jgi:hypothetical protein